MIQSYATDIASVGDSKHHQANNFNEPGTRGRGRGGKGCGGKGSGGGKGASSDTECHYCKKKGHYARDCRKKQSDRAFGCASGGAPAEGQQASDVARGAQQPHVQAGLAQLIENLQRSSQNHVASGDDPRGPGNVTQAHQHSRGTAYRGMRIGEAKHPGPVSQAQQHSRGTGYRGIRIGEAKHPGPSTFTGYLPRLWPAGGGSALILPKLLAVMVTCVSAFDGIGCAAAQQRYN